jgi:hypothetical protein
VVNAREFLSMLSAPSRSKGIPKRYRELARIVLRHYPWWYELPYPDSWDVEAGRLATDQMIIREAADTWEKEQKRGK